MTVFYETEWRSGKLYIRHDKQAVMVRANQEELIDFMMDENQRLKDILGAICDMVES